MKKSIKVPLILLLFICINALSCNNTPEFEENSVIPPCCYTHNLISKWEIYSYSHLIEGEEIHYVRMIDPFIFFPKRAYYEETDLYSGLLELYSDSSFQYKYDLVFRNEDGGLENKEFEMEGIFTLSNQKFNHFSNNDCSSFDFSCDIDFKGPNNNYPASIFDDCNSTIIINKFNLGDSLIITFVPF